MKLLLEIKKAFVLWCNKPTYNREQALEVVLKHVLSKYVKWEEITREDIIQLSELLPEVVRHYDSTNQI